MVKIEVEYHEEIGWSVFGYAPVADRPGHERRERLAGPFDTEEEAEDMQSRLQSDASAFEWEMGVDKNAVLDCLVEDALVRNCYQR